MFHRTRFVYTPDAERAWKTRIAEIGPGTVGVAAILGILFYSVASIFALYMLDRLEITIVLIRAAPVLSLTVVLVASRLRPQWYVPLGYLAWVPLSISAGLGASQVTVSVTASAMQIVPMVLLPAIVILWRPMHTAINAIFCQGFAIVAVKVLAPEHDGEFLAHWFTVAPLTIAGIVFSAFRYGLSRRDFAMGFELKRANEDLSQRNRDLEEAAKQIKTLHGIIPICSHCKSIRDDTGFWAQVESYVQSRTEAEFSHSICPDCIQKHYPELYP